MQVKPGKWDYEYMLAMVEANAPTHRKKSKTDLPIPVVMFRGILVSLYGSPLEKTNDPYAEFQYREMKFKKATYKMYEQYRKSTGRMVVIYPGEMVRKEQFIIAVEDLNGNLDPIVEVSDGKRAELRCRAFSKLLNVAFQSGEDLLVLPIEKYRELLGVIGSRRVL